VGTDVGVNIINIFRVAVKMQQWAPFALLSSYKMFCTAVNNNMNYIYIYIYMKDKIRNTVIKQKMNLTRSLLDDINTKQLKWYGYVQRMEEGRLPKKVMEWNPPGRRKRGRPKAIWVEGIRALMGENGLLEEDWNDRDNWRKKII
jgi:hypothetical protein